MAKFDVIVIGELNVDLLMNDIEQMPQVGKEILAGKMDMALGSSSAIFASNLSTLGTKVAFLGKLGKDDFGSVCLNSLKARDVDTSLVSFDAQNGTGITIVLNYGDDRAMVTYPGAMLTLSLKDIDFDLFSQARHLHLSSIFLQPGIRKDLVTIFKNAKERGMTVSFDPQWDPAEKWDLELKDILPFVDVFLPNRGEFIALTGSDNVEENVRSLSRYSKIIAVKNSKEGSIACCNDVITIGSPFLNETVVDAIGAGDSFNAGFIYKFLQGETVGKCQEFANLIGAVSTTAPGGTGAFKNRKAVDDIAREKFRYRT